MVKMINETCAFNTLQGPGVSNSNLLGSAPSLTSGNKHKHTWLQRDGYTLPLGAPTRGDRHPVPRCGCTGGSQEAQG